MQLTSKSTMPQAYYRSYFSPAQARALPKGSQYKELATCALRNLWHIIFDSCPSVLELCPPDGKKLMEPFLEYAQDKAISLSWTLHVHLLDWLISEPQWNTRIAAVNKKELLAASALHWATSNMADVENIKTKGIVIYSPHYPGHVIGAHKSLTATGKPKLALLKIGGKTPPNDAVYALIHNVDSWEHGDWNSLPI
jgi:hypothetical protein